MTADATAAALKRAVLVDPFDLAARHALADRLIERGRPQGGFIAGQLASGGSREHFLWEAFARAGCWPEPWPLAPPAYTHESGGVTARGVVKNGFVHHVKDTTLDWWLAHGPGVVKRQPVLWVSVRDKSPWVQGDSWWRDQPGPWGAEGPECRLPAPVFATMVGLFGKLADDDRKNAAYVRCGGRRDLLSITLVTVARRAAGLPDLKWPDPPEPPPEE